MKFRNYCLVVIGETKNVLPEIEKISETKPNVLDGKGLFIATFSSAVAPSELNDWFRLNKRNFLIFDLDPECSGFNINKREIHDGLFGFLKTINLEDKSDELLKAIQMTSDTKSNRVRSTSIKETKVVDKIITEEEVDKMSKFDREKLWNKIIDNGVENMTENDKNVLQFLSKY